MGCLPGTVMACYDGPLGTQDVGVCKGGTQVCLPDGNSFGPCMGQILPSPEDCATPQDEDCDGLTPPCGPPSAQTAWTVGFSCAQNCDVRAVGASTSGDVFVAGTFGGQLTVQGMSIQSAGFDDIFLAKLDPLGNLAWIKKIGGVSGDYTRGLAVTTDGGVALVGVVTGTVDFGLGPSFGSGFSESFVARFNPVGDPIWVERHPFQMDASVQAMAIAAYGGHLFVTGYYAGAVDLGGGPLPPGGYGAFAVEIGEDDGAWVWQYLMSGSSLNARSITAAPQGVLVTGDFYGAADLGAGPLDEKSYYRLFVLGLSSGGNFAFEYHPVIGFAASRAVTSAWDAAGSPYYAGTFGPHSGNPGPASVNLGGGAMSSSAMGWDAFMVKLNGVGGYVLGQHVAGSGTEEVVALAPAPNGTVVMTGSFSDDIDFGPVFSGGGWFAAAMSPLGDVTWVKGGGPGALPASTAVDPLGDVFVGGSFYGTTDFGTGPITAPLGITNGFVIKLVP